jgi:putative Mg2+ transporter-C (MgtC) family protein
MTIPNEDIFLGLDDSGHLLRVAVRLAAALMLGALLGWERQKEHKAAGLRTHMLVALGAALFVVVAVEAGIKRDQMSRVIQGLIIGIGFLGGGTILKLSKIEQVRGLTTAANIWLTAAVGLAVGIGLLWPAVISVGLAWLVLAFLGSLERHLEGPPEDRIIPGK